MYEDLNNSYQAPVDLASLQLGEILAEGSVLKNAPVNIVLKSLNRHGLIAGATGSGKTKPCKYSASNCLWLVCPA